MGGKIAGAVAALAAVGVLESKLDPKPGLYRLGDPLRFAEIAAPDELSCNPALLFLHGTASNLSGSFGELMSSADWAPLLAQYDGRVFGWQHFTLSQSPIENALELVAKLPAGARPYIVSHPRGGIVGELLCLGSLGTEDFETFEKVAKREGSWNAERQAQLRLRREWRPGGVRGISPCWPLCGLIELGSNACWAKEENSLLFPQLIVYKTLLEIAI